MKKSTSEKFNKRPLKRSFILGCTTFIVVLCVLLGITTSKEYKRDLYAQYESHIADLLEYVGSNIDVDDLKNCLDTGTKSEKFDQLQSFIDNVKDHHKIDFLYVIIPLHENETDNVMNVIAAMSTYEKEHEPENEVLLGELTGNSYPAEAAAKYYAAADSQEIVFFEESAEWGNDYTGVLSLRTSDGKYFAELCVDVPMSELNQTIRDHIVDIIIIITCIGAIFIILFNIWGTMNIIWPIKRLEKSVSDFVSQAPEQGLIMHDPNVHTRNEIGLLSSSVMQMAADVNGYIDKLVSAERLAAEMSELAIKDALTGVKNRAAFVADVQDLQERIDSKQNVEFAVCVFDCDSLKKINDAYGHDKGDEYIKAASGFIRKIFNNSTIYRIGGDEFATLLLDDDYRNRSDLCDHFYKEIDAVNLSEAEEWAQVHITMGRATFDPLLDQSVSDTMRRADKIMYETKQSKSENSADQRHSFFSPAADAYWKERYVIDNFKTALEEHWIKVYYQPIVRVRTSEICALEALARWIDPVRGTIVPDEFISTLSKYHRLHLLDTYIVEEVCREFSVRREAGLPLIPVSVNISAQDFDSINVSSKLMQIVEKYGLTSADIIVEITEQDLAKGADAFKDSLRMIHENGFKIWIDDFGSGYSALNVISQYNADRIKFDMALLRHLEDNSGANKKILKAMVGVCKELGINTLSEGVETEEQLEFLKEIDCDLAQGYYFYRPEPVDVSVYKFKNRKTDIPHSI